MSDHPISGTAKDSISGSNRNQPLCGNTRFDFTLPEIRVANNGGDGWTFSNTDPFVPTWISARSVFAWIEVRWVGLIVEDLAPVRALAHFLERVLIHVSLALAQLPPTAE